MAFAFVPNASFSSASVNASAKSDDEKVISSAVSRPKSKASVSGRSGRSRATLTSASAWVAKAAVS